jgi:hypothetical protein
MRHTFAVSIGGAAGQGLAAPGNIFARIFAQRGLHLNAYNAYQSIIRGGHTFLTVRVGSGMTSQKLSLEWLNAISWLPKNHGFRCSLTGTAPSPFHAEPAQAEHPGDP